MDENFNVHQPDLDPIPPSGGEDQSQQPDDKNKGSWWSTYKGFFSVVQLFVGALLLAFFINQFIFQSYEVFGQSMSPTLSQGDRLIISKVSKSWNGLWNRDYLPGRGEIVVFKNPRSTSTQLVKRVVGLPGERVVVADGNVTIYNDENPDGFNPDEEFMLELDITDGNADVTVPDNEVFVIGDNRFPNGSFDSRSSELGPIPTDVIVGELVLRVFPVGDIKFY